MTVLLSEASDEEINEECQRRIDRGDRSPDVYCSRQQSDDRAKLGHLRSAIIEMKVASIHAGTPHEWLTALAVTCDQLDAIAGNPLHLDRATAINTIFPGKDNIYQDHSP